MPKRLLAIAFLAVAIPALWRCGEELIQTHELTEQPVRADVVQRSRADAPLEVTQPVEPFIPYFDIPLSKDLQRHTYETCEYYNIPEYYELALALMEHESMFVDSVVGPTDDYGLMQINKMNHKWLGETLGIKNILNPYQNIVAGIYILSSYLLEYEDPTKALMCYNMGERGAQRCWSKGIYSTAYSERILSIYREYIDINK